MLFNGYIFRIPDESVDFTQQIALGKIEKIRTVAKWLLKHSRRSWRMFFLCKLFVARMSDEDIAIMCLTILGPRISVLLRPFEPH